MTTQEGGDDTEEGRGRWRDALATVIIRASILPSSVIIRVSG
jgi:hypothetical protein